MGDIKAAVIKISSVEENNGRYKIKDSEGKTYSFFETLSGKTQKTQAFEQFTTNNHNGPFGVGSVARIGYTEKEGTTRDGSPTVFKNIISMMSSDETPYRAEARPETRTTAQPTHSDSESKEAFGLRLAIHGMTNGLLAGGVSITEAKRMLPELLSLEESINQLLANPLANPSPIEQEVSQEINVDDIPFK